MELSDGAGWLLLTTAFGLGALHTAVGVDHTLPFVVLARAQRWSLRRLWLVTAACGLAHVLSSALLAAGGVAAGVTLERLRWMETHRAEIAGWLLIGFGLAYASAGVYRHLRARRHSHEHVHGDGVVHAHPHSHHAEHTHPHLGAAPALTGWTLFVILVFGPCEPLIPIVMVPALHHEWGRVVALVGVFALATLATMLAAVTLGFHGIGVARPAFLHTHAHTLAGVAILAVGIAVRVFGL